MKIQLHIDTREFLGEYRFELHKVPETELKEYIKKIIKNYKEIEFIAFKAPLTNYDAWFRVLVKEGFINFEDFEIYYCDEIYKVDSDGRFSKYYNRSDNIGCYRDQLRDLL